MPAGFNPPPFVRIPAAEWTLSTTLSPVRRRALHHGPAYQQIVAKLVRECTLVSVKRQRADDSGRSFRVVIQLQMEAATVDLFHNSACGYRAQYYQCAELGKQANVFALSRLLPRVHQLLEQNPKRTCPASWVEMSLSNADAKIWIHQGLWLRRAARADRNLLVARWVAQQTNADEKRRKNAIRAVLTPHNETVLELKGAFITTAGAPLASRKPRRAQDIHELGFT